MKKLFTFVLIFFAARGYSQTFEKEIQDSKSLLKKLGIGDSITYYQCHVEEATQQLLTASGQTLTGKVQAFTITEKYVLTKTEKNIFVKYAIASLTVFPNKKFSGLKIREKDYWLFKQDSSYFLNEKGLKILLSLESKGREAMEYDYPITKYTTNQLIIKHKKDFKQLVIDGQYLISKLIHQN